MLHLLTRCSEIDSSLRGHRRIEYQISVSGAFKQGVTVQNEAFAACRPWGLIIHPKADGQFLKFLLPVHQI